MHCVLNNIYISTRFIESHFNNHQVIEFATLTQKERQEINSNYNKNDSYNNIEELISVSHAQSQPTNINTTTFQLDNEKFITSESQSVFFHPNMNFEKLENFIKALSDEHRDIIARQTVLCLFDETVFGVSDRGLAITYDHLFYRIDLLSESSTMYPISEIGHVEISGLMNKVLKFAVGADNIKLTLTQGNKGAALVAELLNLLRQSR